MFFTFFFFQGCGCPVNIWVIAVEPNSCRPLTLLSMLTILGIRTAVDPIPAVYVGTLFSSCWYLRWWFARSNGGSIL